MKTAKYIALILMLVLLVATVVMGIVLLNRVMALLNPGTPQLQATEPSISSSVPTSSSVIPTTVPPTTVPPTVHYCEYVIRGETIEPGCDMLGYTIYACACGETIFQDYVDSLGHDFGDYVVVPPTCYGGGWTERNCTRCGQNERINPTTAPHTFTEWEPYQYENLEIRKCTDCDGTQVHSADPEETWEVMAIPMGSVNKHTYLKMEITSTKNSTKLVHHLYVHPNNTNVHFDHEGGSLIIYYTHKGEEKSYEMLPNSYELTIRADGVPKSHDPW